MSAASPCLHLLLQLLAFQAVAGQLAFGLMQLVLQPTHSLLLLLKLTCVVVCMASTWGLGPAVQVAT